MTEKQTDDVINRKSKSISKIREWLNWIVLQLVKGLFICGGIAIIVSVYFPNQLRMNYKEIVPENKEQLEEIQNSGKPWLVYCAEKQRNKLKVPTHMELMLKQLYRIADQNIGITDCLESFHKNGDTLVDILDQEIPQNVTRPLGFYIANTQKPKNIPIAFYNTTTIESFVRFQQRESKQKCQQIQTQRDIYNQCNKTACVILLVESLSQSSAIITYFSRRYRYVNFLILNVNNFTLNLGNGYILDIVNDEINIRSKNMFPRILTFRRESSNTFLYLMDRATESKYEIDAFLMETQGKPNSGLQPLAEAWEKRLIQYPAMPTFQYRKTRIAVDLNAISVTPDTRVKL